LKLLQVASVHAFTEPPAPRGLFLIGTWRHLLCLLSPARTSCTPFYEPTRKTQTFNVASATILVFWCWGSRLKSLKSVLDSWSSDTSFSLPNLKYLRYTVRVGIEHLGSLRSIASALLWTTKYRISS
jgi:hypothetical protein